MDAPAATKLAPSPVLADIGKVLPGHVMTTIFDVGANVGQSTLAYAVAAPAARIHSFEPVPRSYAALLERTASLGQVSCWNMALGASRGRASMTGRQTSTGNKIIATASPGTIEATVETGEAFCAWQDIKAISLLKIDTEGHDLAVLQGFGEALRQVDFVQVEAAMNPYNTTHVPFRDLEDHLRAHGFLLFRFYAQTFEFQRSGRPVMRRCDPVFINAALVDVEGIH